MARFLKALIVVPLMLLPVRAVEKSARDGEMSDAPLLRVIANAPGCQGDIKQSYGYGKVVAVTGDSLTLQSLDVMISKSVKSESKDRGRVDLYTGNPVIILWHKDRMATEIMRGVSARVTREAVTVTSASGKKTTLWRADVPLKTFRISATLAAGKFPANTHDGGAYLLSDLRVGDEVSIEARRVKGVWECTQIRINRRPGERVPPSHMVNKSNPYHERANAYQDWEEKGIPLPAKYLPRQWRPVPPRPPARIPLARD